MQGSVLGRPQGGQPHRLDRGLEHGQVVDGGFQGGVVEQAEPTGQCRRGGGEVVELGQHRVDDNEQMFV